ncbi:hypothetical protein NXS19_007642 [Fusarium pseudograminearum]|nr:hypothetical protein NXS19_007642 [Fusarium pseudograminearum]
MLSIPRLHQQQLQLQRQLQNNSSNIHQQYPFAHNCHAEYNAASYSDFPRSNYDDEIAALSQQLPTNLMQNEAWGLPSRPQDSPALTSGNHPCHHLDHLLQDLLLLSAINCRTHILQSQTPTTKAIHHRTTN